MTCVLVYGDSKELSNGRKKTGQMGCGAECLQHPTACRRPGVHRPGFTRWSWHALYCTACAARRYPLQTQDTRHQNIKHQTSDILARLCTGTGTGTGTFDLVSSDETSRPRPTKTMTKTRPARSSLLSPVLVLLLIMVSVCCPYCQDFCISTASSARKERPVQVPSSALEGFSTFSSSRSIPTLRSSSFQIL